MRAGAKAGATWVGAAAVQFQTGRPELWRGWARSVVRLTWSAPPARRRPEGGFIRVGVGLSGPHSRIKAGARGGVSGPRRGGAGRAPNASLAGPGAGAGGEKRKSALRGPPLLFSYALARPALGEIRGPGYLRYLARAAVGRRPPLA